MVSGYIKKFQESLCITNDATVSENAAFKYDQFPKKGNTFLRSDSKGAMERPEDVDCPKCGMPNEYVMGSCRRCGEPRPTKRDSPVKKVIYQPAA